MRVMENEAFERAVHAHKDRVHSYAVMMLRDVEEARDVAQEALVRLWNNRNKVDPDGARPWLMRATHNLCIEVADRGPGISKENQERIFDPFFTTKTQGSGVGLAVSRRFVEEAGGTIEVRDRSGGGTEMIIKLRGYSDENPDR